ncbi:MAG: DUF3788 domain-containing protein [Defluviitaleaceae bacterium]|nr:DUF3788 domain-containing protein [Defluviitaleaceae bacterium]
MLYEYLLPALGGSKTAWDELMAFINQNYEMEEKWDTKKPSSEYRNELKFRRGGKTLLALYLRDGFFEVNIIFGKGEMEKFEQSRSDFSAEIQKIYDDVEICHGQKWMFIEMYDSSLLEDIFKMLLIKREPNRK